MDFKLIGLGVVVVILIYVLYAYYTSKTTTLLKTVSLSASNTGIAIVDVPQSYRYTYNVWIYVNTWDWSTGGTMPIFYREVTTPGSAYVGGTIMGTTNTGNNQLVATVGANKYTGAQFALFLAQDSPTLFCQIPEATPGVAPFQITGNFPIQTWTYITISVDSQYVDFYVNGKLAKSVQLTKIPSQPGNKDNLLYVGKGGDITISGLQRISSPSAPQDVWSAYINGNPAGTTSSSYNINMDLVKNKKVQSTYNIF